MILRVVNDVSITLRLLKQHFYLKWALWIALRVNKLPHLIRLIDNPIALYLIRIGLLLS